MAASNIGQYELAVSVLGKYHWTIALGILAYFSEKLPSVFHHQVIGRDCSKCVSYATISNNYVTLKVAIYRPLLLFNNSVNKQ